MGVRPVVAVTDRDWFDHLRLLAHQQEVNFWAPSATPFKALTPGEFFLFKLHAPENFIVGGGVFAYANILPCSLAWEAFGQANGASSLSEMRTRIMRYRREVNGRSDFQIGCRILTQPFFLERERWIDLPASWSRNIVTFKTYSTDDPDGKYLWDRIQETQARISPKAHPTKNRPGTENLCSCVRALDKARFVFSSLTIMVGVVRLLESEPCLRWMRPIFARIRREDCMRFPIDCCFDETFTVCLTPVM